LRIKSNKHIVRKNTNMKAIRHSGIVISDREKALRFYQDLLGLTMHREMVESGDFISDILGLKDVKVNTMKLKADDGNLVELLHFVSHPRKVVPYELCDMGPTHVAFTVEDLDKEYERLTAAGVSFTVPPQVSVDGNAKVTFCKDPDGNYIELVQMLK